MSPAQKSNIKAETPFTLSITVTPTDFTRLTHHKHATVCTYLGEPILMSKARHSGTFRPAGIIDLPVTGVPSILARFCNGVLSTSVTILLKALARLSILLLGSVAIAATSPSEYQVKAVFLFNFTQFVDWPAQTFTDPQTPFVI